MGSMWNGKATGSIDLEPLTGTSWHFGISGEILFHSIPHDFAAPSSAPVDHRPRSRPAEANQAKGVGGGIHTGLEGQKPNSSTRFPTGQWVGQQYSMLAAVGLLAMYDSTNEQKTSPVSLAGGAGGGGG